MLLDTLDRLLRREAVARGAGVVRADGQIARGVLDRGGRQRRRQRRDALQSQQRMIRQVMRQQERRAAKPGREGVGVGLDVLTRQRYSLKGTWQSCLRRKFRKRL